MSHKNKTKKRSVNQKSTMADFICRECYNLTKVQEVIGEETKKYSIKKLYCYNCEKETNHLGVKNSELTERMLEFTNDRNYIEEKAYQLIKKSNNRRNNESR